MQHKYRYMIDKYSRIEETTKKNVVKKKKCNRLYLIIDVYAMFTKLGYVREREER